MIVESDTGESSSVDDQTSFAEDETYKRHPGTGSQPQEEEGLSESA